MSAIEWTDETWNPVIGCTPVSPGCLNCYAARVAERLQTMPRMSQYVGLTVRHKGSHKAAGPVDESRMMATGKVSRPVFNGTVRCLPHKLDEPLHWRTPRRVFVNSMSDLFHESVPFEFIDRVFAVMALCPRHTFQVLTKRPERMAEYLGGGTRGRTHFHVYNCAAEHTRGDFSKFPGDMAHTRSSGGSWWPLPNVWLGASVERQHEADERLPHLLRCPAALRFLSCEPLLGPVELRPSNGHPDLVKLARSLNGPVPNGIDWVIVGGESGPRSRPCDVAWIRSIVRQCQDAGVPCFVKQLGARPRINYYQWLRWCEERRWDSLDARIVTPEGHEWKCERDGQPRSDALAEFPNRVGDPKGGDPSEWPADLRVRQFPEVAR